MESWIITVYTPSCIAIFILLDDNWTKWNQLKGYFMLYLVTACICTHVHHSWMRCRGWVWAYWANHLILTFHFKMIERDLKLCRHKLWSDPCKVTLLSHRSGFVKQTSLLYRPSTDCLLSLRQCFTLEWWYVTSCGVNACIRYRLPFGQRERRLKSFSGLEI